jgi:hypothetical protein
VLVSLGVQGKKSSNSRYGEPRDGPCDRQPIISGVRKIVTDSHLQESKKEGRGRG